MHCTESIPALLGRNQWSLNKTNFNNMKCNYNSCLDFYFCNEDYIAD